jgi:hypothetical protein
MCQLHREPVVRERPHTAVLAKPGLRRFMGNGFRHSFGPALVRIVFEAGDS